MSAPTSTPSLLARVNKKRLAALGLATVVVGAVALVATWLGLVRALEVGTTTRLLGLLGIATLGLAMLLALGVLALSQLQVVEVLREQRHRSADLARSVRDLRSEVRAVRSDHATSDDRAAAAIERLREDTAPVGTAVERVETTLRGVEGLGRELGELATRLDQLDSAASATRTDLRTSTERLREDLRRAADRTSREGWRRFEQVEGLVSLYRSLDGAVTLPSFRRWAISPDLGAYLLRLVGRSRPALVVEAGSGSSTVLLGHAVRQYGGAVVALEHDAAYASNTRGELAAHGLQDVVTVLHASLVPHDVDGETFDWYDLEDLDLPGPIDLLVVDGPPGTTGPRARFPAVPLLLNRMAPDATVLLDDVVRDDERAVAESWATMPGWQLRILQHEKGTAVLRRRVDEARAGATAGQGP